MIFEPLPVTNLHPQNIRVRDWMRDSDFEKFRKCLRTVENAGSGERIRTSDLRVMRPMHGFVIVCYLLLSSVMECDFPRIPA